MNVINPKKKGCTRNFDPKKETAAGLAGVHERPWYFILLHVYFMFQRAHTRGEPSRA